MEIIAYGEDALTLWAMTNKLNEILRKLKDSSDSSRCQVFFRPSFGRSGGSGRSEFGEFDFILLSDEYLYLGESKWNRSGERIQNGHMKLRDEQLERHRLLKFYIEEWVYGEYTSWQDFKTHAEQKLQLAGSSKLIAPETSLLAENLRTVFAAIKIHYSAKPTIKNVLLYMKNDSIHQNSPLAAGQDFNVVLLDYSEIAYDNFIRLKI